MHEVKNKMKEVKLNPIDTGKDNKAGDRIFNLNLKSRLDKATGEYIVGLKAGEFIVVEKVFKGGYETKRKDYSFYSVTVKYDDKTCSFLLYEKDMTKLEEVGGIGDKVKISANSYSYMKKNKNGSETETKALGLNFELVE